MAVIYLSFDQDWAPAWATLDVHNALAAAGLSGTLFVTHACPSLPVLRARPDILELGWHPNFLPGSSHGNSTEAVLDTLAELVPEAVGARAHCLIRGTPFLQAYQARGLVYDAADIHDGEAGLAPFASWTGMWRLPIWFEDDVHLQRGLPCRLDALDLAARGMKIMTFHPVLVALNAADLNGYAALKDDLRAQGVELTEATREHFAPHRSTGPGVADLFDAIVAWLTEHPDRAGGMLRSAAGHARPLD